MVAVELVRELVGDGSAGAENGLHGAGLLGLDGVGVHGNSTAGSVSPPRGDGWNVPPRCGIGGPGPRPGLPAPERRRGVGRLRRGTERCVVDGAPGKPATRRGTSKGGHVRGGTELRALRTCVMFAVLTQYGRVK
ncbi:hypothetical protein GCM10017667_70810 [Streptomyces filamentosus]|uniref:Uncharacterized protein n=1 Tax=Streptomyces filamentosus TaxID=67294 RepID=A0A919ERU6_STRFL|nr:hypothetical protein GCM10017667_70810 [Streptomyces filamentosus]